MHDNKEEQNLDKYQNKGEGKKHVFFPFIAFPPPSQRKSYCLTNLDKKTKSLNQLVYILKICYSEEC